MDDHTFDGHGGHVPDCLACRLEDAETRVQQLEAALRDVREALWSENFIAWPLISRGRCDEAIDAALTPRPAAQEEA